MTAGGTITIRVTKQGEVLAAHNNLADTQMNRSGGIMPWGAWVTCEETVCEDSPDGHTLFVNIHASRGMSFAIWGPWRSIGVCGGGPSTGAATVRPGHLLRRTP